MNKPTRKECTELIEKLADKTLSFGCVYKIRSGTFTLDTGNYRLSDNKKSIEIISICNHLEYTNCCAIYQNQDDEPVIEPILEIIGHPVMLGDVLERIKELRNKDKSIGTGSTFRVNELWWYCGFTKSLNELMEKSGFEVDCHVCEGVCALPCHSEDHKETLKDPATANLFQFLIELFSIT